MWISTLCLVAMFGCCMAYNPGVGVVINAFKCDDLWPMFAEPDKKTPQIMPSPFKIQVANYSYVPAQEITVNLTAPAGRPFRTFIILARTVASGKFQSMAGSFSQPLGDPIITVPACQNRALTSRTQDAKYHVRLVWRAPDNYRGNVEFRATFVEDANTFWVAEKSKKIYDIKSSPPVKVDKPIALIPPIETDTCGIEKGCYREPEGCQEYACQYIVTWKDLGTSIEFELGGLTDTLDDRYVAVAFSNDTYMGEDIVLECVHNSRELDENVKVYESVNIPHQKSNVRLAPKTVGEREAFIALLTERNPQEADKIRWSLSDESAFNKMFSTIEWQQGSYFNGRLRCRFRRYEYHQDKPLLLPLTGRPWHFLFARGTASVGKIHRHGLGVGEFPIASPDKASINSHDGVYADINGRARYPRVKAHGCFMLFAWIFCATIGLILTKYYKKMWPNSRLFGQRYWFLGHFNLMVLCFLAVVIGFILIFIEAQGYSQAPDLPQKAHPILGIIIFVCVVINPLIALIRPSEESKWRPCFNWIHFVFGFIANVLSIPNIFIGMDFGKVNVPWWATWILVFYVIFHIVIELTLEIHQCCMYKKDKKRRQKYEIQKRETQKFIPEPQPAGARFKKNMLFLHMTVTTIITLIMIIILAVC